MVILTHIPPSASADPGGTATTSPSFMPDLVTCTTRPRGCFPEPRRVCCTGHGQMMALGDVLVEIHAASIDDAAGLETSRSRPPRPTRPYAHGFVGKIVASNVQQSCHFRSGEWVLAFSGDHQDNITSSMKKHVIVRSYNTIRIPRHHDPIKVACAGDAYLTAALVLGICLGVSFKRGTSRSEFSLLDIAQAYPDEIPDDLKPEVLRGISPACRAQPGEWILVSGASTTVGKVIVQLAKYAGLKVVAVERVREHRHLLASLKIDALVDSTDLDQAKRHLKQLVPNSLRFAVDALGPETATWCHDILAARTSSRYSSPGAETPTNPAPVDLAARGGGSKLSHLVTLAGDPVYRSANIQLHTAPMRLFHSHRHVGNHMSHWLYELLKHNVFQPPTANQIATIKAHSLALV